MLSSQDRWQAIDASALVLVTGATAEQKASCTGTLLASTVVPAVIGGLLGIIPAGAEQYRNPRAPVGRYPVGGAVLGAIAGVGANAVQLRDACF
jgi:hypothetical protein